jgi:N utilization substance protein B
MAARSKARKRALDILFEAELRGLPTLGLLSERQSLGDVPVHPYAAELVRGVAAHSERIDELISWNLVDWTMERMPAVDRNILRIGVY